MTRVNHDKIPTSSQKIKITWVQSRVTHALSIHSQTLTPKSSGNFRLGAITTYGHAQLFLTDDCRLLGALEALNGIILIGMTTALIYGLIQRVWPVESRALPHVPWSNGDKAP